MVLLLALATLLAPAAVVAAWARVQLTTADAFVDTFAPVADDAQVQAFVAGQAVDAINGAVDIPGLTKDVFDGIGQIGLPPRAAAALQLLQAPATQGIQSFIIGGVDNVVRSEAFRDLWRQGLRATRGAAETRGLSTGRFGEWLGSHDRAIRIVIAIAAAAAIVLLRPLSFSDVVWVAVLALVALLLLLFLSRPQAGAPATKGEEAHTPAVAGLT